MREPLGDGRDETRSYLDDLIADGPCGERGCVVRVLLHPGGRIEVVHNGERVVSSWWDGEGPRIFLARLIRRVEMLAHEGWSPLAVPEERLVIGPAIAEGLTSEDFGA